MGYLVVIAATFGVMYLLDKGLTKLFRGREQHRSGTAVRLKKHYGILSLAMMILGALGILTFFFDGNVILLLGGVALMAFNYVTMMRGSGYHPDQGMHNGLGGQGNQQSEVVKADMAEPGEQSPDIWEKMQKWLSVPLSAV